MSTSTDYPERLNLAEQVARIERMNMETAKLREELAKVRADPEQAARIERSQEETRKFVAEQHKVTAEAANLRVSRIVTPTAAVIAALGALTAAAPVVARWLGVGG